MNQNLSDLIQQRSLHTERMSQKARSPHPSAAAIVPLSPLQDTYQGTLPLIIHNRDNEGIIALTDVTCEGPVSSIIEK